MGLPVVIAENGLGLPVMHADDAPRALIAGNGLGVPIVMVHENGVPMNIDAGPGPGGSVPTNVSPPTVTASAPLINIEEDAKSGVWQSDSDVTYAYQWQSSEDGETWADIDGADTDTYVPTFVDRQKYIRVSVIATNDTGTSDPVFSAATALIGPYDFQINAGIYGAPSGDTGYDPGRMGSLIGKQPIPGHDLAALFSRAEGYGNIAFEGDCVSVVAGLKLVLSGSAPNTWGTQSDFILSGGETQCSVSPTSSFPMDGPTNVTWEQAE